MKVSGFSFIRNAIKYDYPIVEAITSILPICDEFVVAIGNSDDENLLLKNQALEGLRVRLHHKYKMENILESEQIKIEKIYFERQYRSRHQPLQ